jgi:hypothetical protein
LKVLLADEKQELRRMFANDDQLGALASSEKLMFKDSSG